MESSLLVGILLLAAAQAVSVPARRSVNTNPLWTEWPNGNISYYIDAAYTDDQAEQIRAAAEKVRSDMSGCIRFVEIRPQSSEFKIHVTPNKPGKGGREKRCFSYAGIYTPLRDSGAKEQRVVLTDGPEGCFDGSLHSLMKYFTIILGKINEHQRSDRDDFITVNTTNLLPNTGNIYKRHEKPMTVSTCPYDYCSITHNQPDVYAKHGKDAFVVKQKPFYIPKLNRLSECDCKDLSVLYAGCQAEQCTPLNCADLDETSAESEDADAV